MFYLCCNEAQQTSGLKEKKYIVSQFWSLEMWNQVVGSTKVPLKLLGKNLCPFQASGGAQHLADDSITPISFVI